MTPRIGFSSYADLLHSNLYANQVNEVKRLGQFDAEARGNRTPEQTKIALFWSNDVDGTYKPPGQQLDHTRIISQQRGLTLQQNARLFGLLGLALGDAAIASWDSKYDTQIDLWRPETAIQLAGTDNNPATTADPAWKPLLLNQAGNTHVSPCFPAYTSGHATFGGTWARVLQRYFGTDAITFTGTTDDPQARGMTRTFTSLRAAGEEDAISRIYLGVHYRFDADFGLSSGRSVADFVVNQLPQI
ncbi:MAG: vanadium-dependent haloperoxidase [Pseudonocardiaceae bacterium]